MVKRQMRDLSYSVVYCFKCDLCESNCVGYTTRNLFQRIADHRYSAIGRHLRDAHGNIGLLNESQFKMLKKCSTKWDCLVYEMLYIRTIRPNLNTRSGSIRAKLFVQLSIYSSLHYIYLISLFYFHLIMTFWKRRAMFYNILSKIFIVKCFTKSLLARYKVTGLNPKPQWFRVAVKSGEMILKLKMLLSQCSVS